MPKSKSHSSGKTAVLEGVSGVRDDTSRPLKSENGSGRAKSRRSVVKDRAKASVTHAEIATKYAQDVVSGAIPACKWVKLACQRQLSDLERQNTAEFPWIFDEHAANR